MRKVIILLLLLAPSAALRAAGELRLHFKPHDHALGDVHPYFHEGECFLFYLKPGKYDSMLARSRDSLRWTPQPLTHAPVQAGYCERRRDPFRLDFAPLGSVRVSKVAIQICDAGGTCWSELDARWKGDFGVAVFVQQDLVEVFADDRHSLCARLPTTDQPMRVSWSADGSGFSPRDILTTLLQAPPGRP